LIAGATDQLEPRCSRPPNQPYFTRYLQFTSRSTESRRL